MSYQHLSATRVEENDTFKPTTLGYDGIWITERPRELLPWRTPSVWKRENPESPSVLYVAKWGAGNPLQYHLPFHIEIIFAQKKRSFGKFKPNYYIIHKHNIHIRIHIYTHYFVTILCSPRCSHFQNLLLMFHDALRCLDFLRFLFEKSLRHAPCGAWMSAVFKNGLHWRWNSITMHFC